jgi:hypothetical protein
MKRALLALLAGSIVLLGVTVSAWTGPLQSPPGCTSGNPGCDAPINVGAAAQIKNGTVGVNGIAVFGNTILSGTNSAGFAYLNFGTTAGTSGYGIWDNGGTLEFKNSGGSWQTLNSSGYWTAGSNGIYYNGGNVGIGTVTPGSTLDVAGKVNANSETGAGGFTSTGNYGGTGSAAYFPSGLWSNGASAWIYGNVYTNGNIYTVGTGYYLNPGATSVLSGLTVGGSAVCTANGTNCPASSGVGGSGTANYVPRFTAATTLGNSTISDNGSSATANGNFFVNGDLYDGQNAGYYLKPSQTSKLVNFQTS